MEGIIQSPKYIHGYLIKDEKTNRAAVSDQPVSGGHHIETFYEPLGNNGRQITAEGGIDHGPDASDPGPFSFGGTRHCGRR